MPPREAIPVDDLRMPAFGLWNRQWLLLTAGDFAAGAFNTMTVSWGGLGYMWNKPLAIVVVRPQRYTFEFMEKYPTYTLSAYPPERHPALELLGTKSGREGDKIKEAGLTPIASTQIPAPAFAEAELILECRKMYYQDLDPSHFLASHIAALYKKDYHRVYWGEVVAATAAATYRGQH